MNTDDMEDLKGNGIYDTANSSDSYDDQKITELSAELRALEEKILPGLRDELDWLTRPGPAGSKNVSHELSEQVIMDLLKSEIAMNEKRATNIRAQMKRLSDK